MPGAGVGGPNTMVLVLGTSGCHMLNSTEDTVVPGVAGIVQDGILPGLVGYESGQSGACQCSARVVLVQCSGGLSAVLGWF